MDSVLLEVAKFLQGNTLNNYVSIIIMLIAIAATLVTAIINYKSSIKNIKDHIQDIILTVLSEQKRVEAETKRKITAKALLISTQLYSIIYTLLKTVKANRVFIAKVHDGSISLTSSLLLTILSEAVDSSTTQEVRAKYHKYLMPPDFTIIFSDAEKDGHTYVCDVNKMNAPFKGSHGRGILVNDGINCLFVSLITVTDSCLLFLCVSYNRPDCIRDTNYMSDIIKTANKLEILFKEEL